MSLLRVAISVQPEDAEETIAALLDHAPAGLVEEDDCLVVYADEERAAALRENFSVASVEPVLPGWEDEWRRFHTPVVVGPLWIGPPWLEPESGHTPVIIDPGRAFGTGGHETTRLCLDLMLTCEPGSLIDVGCGSGVLAIAAAKLGFLPVLAVDFEPAATEAADRNAAANAVQVDVRTLDARAAELPPAEVAVANVALDTVKAIGPHLDVERLIASGYLVEDALRLPGYRHLDRREGDLFAADLFARE